MEQICPKVDDKDTMKQLLYQMYKLKLNHLKNYSYSQLAWKDSIYFNSKICLPPCHPEPEVGNNFPFQAESYYLIKIRYYVISVT